ncbi:MAG: hypothetical protein WAM14_21550 [Candidatus Nitrosopolaris sp.]
MQKRFPSRNYNRAIEIPEYVIPDCVDELNDIVREKAVYILKEERTKMGKRFSNNTALNRLKGTVKVLTTTVGMRESLDVLTVAAP